MIRPMRLHSWAVGPQDPRRRPVPEPVPTEEEPEGLPNDDEGGRIPEDRN